MNSKNIYVLHFLGILLLLFVLFKISYNIYYYNYFYTIFWFCNFAALLLSIGIIFKFKSLVGAVFLASLPAQFVWFLDFLLYIIFGLGFGRTSDLFNESLFEFLLSVTFHIIIIPISIYSVIVYGLSRKSFMYAVTLFIFILLPLTYFLTPLQNNINCVFFPCDMSHAEFTDSQILSGLYFIFVLGFWSFISLSIYLMYNIFLKNKIKFVDD
ncbi:MAG: hypothetical protein LAT82_00010 [Nanoarchaeota archaeon]|nr:hypothetical protein [Nanoarchaeota archaeon]